MNTQRPRLAATLPGFVFFLACNPSPVDPGETAGTETSDDSGTSSASTSSTEGSSSDSASDGGTAGSATSTDSGSGSGSGGESGGSGGPVDCTPGDPLKSCTPGVGMFDCSDPPCGGGCDDGYRCTMALHTFPFDGQWACVPVEPQPAQLGEPCEFSQSPDTDNCAEGLACLTVDDEPRCMEMCRCENDAYGCDDPDKLCIMAEQLCAVPCSPLDPTSCAANESCRYLWDSNAYFCMPETGVPDTEDCTEHLMCGPGLVCPVDGTSALVDCPDNKICCAQSCEVGKPGCCPEGLECLPVHGPEDAQCHDGLGFCGVGS